MKQPRLWSVQETMDPTEVSRSVYVGSQSRHRYRITSLSVVPLDKIETSLVSSIEEYESGCSECVSECYGHMCHTPAGAMLVPQSLAARRGETSNEYLDAAKLAFAGRLEEYTEYLVSINKTKMGHMRKDILGSSVLGSMRLIIAPACNSPAGVIYIPRTIAGSLRTPYEVVDEATGRSTGVVGERPVADGDMCILWRPPSLTYSSIRPYTVRVHDSPVMKLPIQCAKKFHADFDGDEMQLCMIYSEGAIRECAKWKHEGSDEFDIAHSIVVERYSNLPESHLPQSFISYTNMTMKEVMEGKPPPMFATASRMKPHNILETGQRFRDPQTVRANFVKESLRGCVDVTRQQLLQGPMGLKSRIAKIASSCFFRSHGSLYVQTSRGPKALALREARSHGCPALRGISLFCAHMQQAALDSHRAQSSDIPLHDMISDMISGSASTVVAVRCNEDGQPEATWKAWKDGHCYCIVNKEEASLVDYSTIVAAYSPWILRHVLDPESCALAGVALVSSYFNIPLSRDEALDMASVFSYQCGASDYPITSTRGLKARDLGLVEKWMSGTYSDIGHIPSAVFPEAPNTMVAASMLGEFLIGLH